jgi:hypothetical protein
MLRFRRAQTRKSDEWVSASDIGTYAYCARLYRMSKVDRVPLNGRGKDRLAAGTRGHNRHGHLYDLQVGLRRTAVRMAWVAAGLAAVVALVYYASAT